MSYREVIPDQTLPDVWREVTLNTGGTQSTLQDIKVSEKANGYSYRAFAKHHTRNRFIYWRINHDVLELVEQSLDVNLTGNKVKYRFIDTPILDGITIYETFDNVIILVPTVCSVHRLIFVHPDVIHKQNDITGVHPDLTVASIFAETSAISSRDSSIFNVFNNPITNSQLPQVATSLLTAHEEAIFLFGYPSGELLLVKQSANSHCTSIELKHETFMPRFISGIAEKFRSKMSDGNVVVSMLLHTLGMETYAFTLSRDGNLRVWQCSKGHCIAAADLNSEITSLGQRLTQGSQNHILRKINTDDELELNLVVFMSFSTECQFHIFKTSISNTQFKIARINTLYSPAKDLVDFNVSSNQIWSMWRSEDGDTAVYNTELFSSSGEASHWIPVTLEPIPDADFVPDMNSFDPRQAYLNHIFYPSRFPLAVINKALSIYKRSQILSEVSLSPSILKQRVSLAVENEIQNELKETEVSDEDYLECAYWCWAKFYSCCVQYHVAGLRPLGLLVLSSASGVVLLKKSMYSFLRPHDALEHMMMCFDYVSVKDFSRHPILSENMSVTDDVIKLMNVIVYLEQQLSDVFKYTFERELSQLKLPDIVMSEIITEILTEMDDQFTWSIYRKLNVCKDIYQAMHKLLELLRVETSHVSEDDDMDGMSSESLNYMFSSRLGVSLVTKCLHQQAVVRFTICRNLLFIQNILIQEVDQKWNALEAVRSVCRVEIVMLIQASYAILYLTELISLPVLPIESSMTRLASLKLDPVFNIKTNSKQTITLVDHFITSTSGFEAHKMLSKLNYDHEIVMDWNISLLTYTNLITQQLWPLTGSSIFAEWLLSSGQHIWLQQYVRLLNDWCEWNNSTRNFLLAVSFLSTGEHKKAQDLFLKAAKGIFTDKFLMDRILCVPGSDDERRAYVNYYLKVIQLFDLHGARDCAISIATKALSNVDPKDPHVATLYSIKFIHHLSLQHYDQAYNSINSNPDEGRKKDNLRDLVKTLFDHKELDKLMTYSYTDLDQHCYNIVTDYARASDPLHNSYYDFLYAFCINRTFFRLAASVMYEQAYRLKHYNTIEALEKQIKCYLACINALSLVSKNQAYLIKPTDPDAEPEVITIPKRYGSDDRNRLITIENKIVLLEIADVKPELELASARLRLVRFYPRNLTDSLITPTEVVGYLSSAGMFKYALLLCKTFGIKYDTVFDALAKQCVYLTETEDPNAWKWLIENDLHDLNIVANSPSTVAWNLLQTYLEEYEDENMTTLHKVVCRKIVQMQAFIPYWILATYKLRNPAELLRLYYFSGRLDDAIEVACEYILAALGHGKEYYGFKYALSSMSPPFCLPINIIDSLINELHLQNEHALEKPFEKEYEKLKDLFQKYLETVARVTKEVCQLKSANTELPLCITVSS
ncbi:hypothetical protein RN001_012201 [Aquatica leii]|uniref:Nuclear pore complex protein Nup160 homolog n=1 Tax=Aquatica leii TaxID=1421715 RepID=A0AAN7PSM6_9COLE|nr:hypothetical protein RN001_012201 [Aquatica leii]